MFVCKDTLKNTVKSLFDFFFCNLQNIHDYNLRLYTLSLDYVLYDIVNKGNNILESYVVKLLCQVVTRPNKNDI